MQIVDSELIGDFAHTFADHIYIAANFIQLIGTAGDHLSVVVDLVDMLGDMGKGQSLLMGGCRYLLVNTADGRDIVKD